MRIFSVRPDTVISSADGKALVLKNLSTDNTISVEYLFKGKEPEETFVSNKAESITVIE